MCWGRCGCGGCYCATALILRRLNRAYTYCMLLQGIFPAITTPFYPDGRLYLKKLEHNVDRYSRTPISGMVVLGSTGETVMLSDEEQRSVLKLAIEVASAEKVMVAGVGQESTFQTLLL